MWAGLIYIKLLTVYYYPILPKDLHAGLLHGIMLRYHLPLFTGAMQDNIRENNQGAMVRLEVRMSITNIELNSKVTF